MGWIAEYVAVLELIKNPQSNRLNNLQPVKLVLKFIIVFILPNILCKDKKL